MSNFALSFNMFCDMTNQIIQLAITGNLLF